MTKMAMASHALEWRSEGPRSSQECAPSRAPQELERRVETASGFQVSIQAHGEGQVAHRDLHFG